MKQNENSDKSCHIREVYFKRCNGNDISHLQIFQLEDKKNLSSLYKLGASWILFSTVVRQH